MLDRGMGYPTILLTHHEFNQYDIHSAYAGSLKITSDGHNRII